MQTFTAPLNTIYKIECWGAQGGNDMDGRGGLGAYTAGDINLLTNTKLYVCVGCYGTRGSKLIYINGGGITHGAASGGGSSDVRLTGGTWNDFASLKSRIMVAAGGGGGENVEKHGGYGGALTGGANHDNTVLGATQTSGYGFGVARYTLLVSNKEDGWGGGGNGYYSGYSSENREYAGYITGGGGGSSFISGYPGCNAIAESSTESNIIHTGQPNHYSGKVFTNPVMIAGNATMPKPNGATETGHSGNGYCIIAWQQLPQ